MRAAPALQGTYAASKAALEALSETLQKELEPFGVKVLVISAGGIREEIAAQIADLIESPEPPRTAKVE